MFLIYRGGKSDTKTIKKTEIDWKLQKYYETTLITKFIIVSFLSISLGYLLCLRQSMVKQVIFTTDLLNNNIINQNILSNNDKIIGAALGTALAGPILGTTAAANFGIESIKKLSTQYVNILNFLEIKKNYNKKLIIVIIIYLLVMLLIFNILWFNYNYYLKQKGKNRKNMQFLCNINLCWFAIFFVSIAIYFIVVMENELIYILIFICLILIMISFLFIPIKNPLIFNLSIQRIILTIMGIIFLFIILYNFNSNRIFLISLGLWVLIINILIINIISEFSSIFYTIPIFLCLLIFFSQYKITFTEYFSLIISIIIAIIGLLILNQGVFSNANKKYSKLIFFFIIIPVILILLPLLFTVSWFSIIKELAGILIYVIALIVFLIYNLIYL